LPKAAQDRKQTVDIHDLLLEHNTPEELRNNQNDDLCNFPMSALCKPVNTGIFLNKRQLSYRSLIALILPVIFTCIVIFCT